MGEQKMQYEDFLTERQHYHLTTNILHYLVYNNQTNRYATTEMIMNHYMLDVEKPEEIQFLFQKPSLALCALIFTFIEKEKENAECYQRNCPKPNIIIKEKPTEKMINYLLLLAKKRSYIIDNLETLSKKECAQLINKLK